MKFYNISVIIGLLSGLLWAGNNLFISQAYIHLPENIINISMQDTTTAYALALTIAGLNDLFAATAITIYNLICGYFKHIEKHLLSRYVFSIILASIIGGPIGQVCYFIGIMKSSPAYSLIFTSLYPIFGCILARVFLKQTITPIMWFGIFISVSGAIITGYSPITNDNSSIYVGIIFSIIAAICWGMEMVLASYGMEKINANIAINIRELISCSTLLIVILPIVNGYYMISELNTQLLSFKYILVAGIMAGFSYFMWYYTNNKLGCAKGMALNSTYIIWGVLLSFIFIDSSWNANILLGCIMVLLGTMMVTNE